MNLSSIGKLALIGAGKMGLALARGWLAAGLPAERLTLVDPNPAPLARDLAAEHGLALVSEIAGLMADVVVLAVKPQIIGSVMEQARAAIGPETLVVSIAAGISIATLSRGMGTGRVIRCMPNTPAQIGKGMTGIVAAPEATEGDRAIAEALLLAAGKVVWFDEESRIDGVTAVSGSGPAYVFYLVEALAEAARKQGFGPEEAMLLARQTVIGAAALMEADPTPASTLRENVTSPKGTTAAALDILMGPQGLAPVIERAVEAARARSEELGRG